MMFGKLCSGIKDAGRVFMGWGAWEVWVAVGIYCG